MKTMSARDAKNAFGMLIDTARAEPVVIEKHGRRVVVVLSVEEFDRLRQQRQEAYPARTRNTLEKRKNERG
jgi:prevent-host-death family protein